MNTLVQAAHTLSPAAANLLIASVWQGLLLTAGVGLILALLRSVSPAVRTWIWTAVLVLVVCLPVLAVLLPRPSVVGHAELHVAEDWSVALLAVWASFSVLRAGKLVASGVRLWGLARRATPVEVTAPVAAMLQGPRRAQLCVSPEVDRPSVTGFFWPRVLLPVGLLETLSEAELEHVVLHEMEHLRRCDDWLNLLQQISLVLLPLNPALVWLDRRLCRERELACDDGVLQTTQARKAYAACLVKLAEDSLVRKGVALALSALGAGFKRGARESELVGRVRRILAGPERIPGSKHMPFALGALSVAMLAGAGLLARSPQMVSFDAGSEAVARATVAPLPQVSGSHMMPVSAVLGGQGVRPVMARAVLDRPAMASVRPASTPAKVRRHARMRVVPVRASVPRIAPWTALPVKATVETAPAMQPALGLPTVPAPRVVVTEFEVSQPLFAAVPVQGGWLIVQL